MHGIPVLVKKIFIHTNSPKQNSYKNSFKYFPRNTYVFLIFPKIRNSANFICNSAYYYHTNIDCNRVNIG